MNRNRFEEINVELAELDAQAAPLREAIARAGQEGMEHLPEVMETFAKRRSVAADFLLGIVNRSALEKIHQEAKAAEAAQAKAAQGRELAQMGVSVLEERLAPIQHKIAALHLELRAAARATIREQAEEAGVAYRNAIEVMARAYANLQAHAEVLNDLERVGLSRTEPPADGYRSFGGIMGPVGMQLPVYPDLEAFQACALPLLPVVYRAEVARPGSQVQIDYPQVLAALQRKLIDQGLPVR